MRGYITFVKKEIYESIATYRGIIFAAVILVLGLMSPLFARLTPQIISSIDMNGLEITIPDPTALDSMAQFFKNMTQMGLIAMILVFGVTLSGEIEKGTLVNVLTKGLTRHSVVLAKFTVSTLLWTLAFTLASVVNLLYTKYLFDDISILSNMFMAHFSIWLFGVMVISMLLMCNAIISKSLGSLGLGAGILVALYLLYIPTKIQRFNPIALVSENLNLVSGQTVLSYMTPSIIITAVFTVAFLVASIMVFDKKII